MTGFSPRTRIRHASPDTNPELHNRVGTIQAEPEETIQ